MSCHCSLYFRNIMWFCSQEVLSDMCLSHPYAFRKSRTLITNLFVSLVCSMICSYKWFFLVLTDDVIAHILTLNDNCRAPSLNCRTYSLNNIYRETQLVWQDPLGEKIPLVWRHIFICIVILFCFIIVKVQWMVK